MSNKKENQTITINGEEHDVDSLTQEQISLVNHVSDLDNKIKTAQFSLDQLSVGRNAFMNMLTESLSADVPEEVEL